MASGGWASRLALRIRTALLSSGQCTAEKKQAVLNLWMFSSGRHGTGLQQDMGHRKGTLALVDARQGSAKRDRLFPHRPHERNSRGRSGKQFEIFCPSKELKRWPSSSPLTRFTGIKNGIASNHNHPIWGLGPQPNGTLTGHSRSHPAREPEFFPPRPVSISPGHLQQDDCGAAVVLFTHSPECIVGRGRGRSGGGCRIRQGVLLLATDTTPTHHAWAVDVARDSPVDGGVDLNSGARAPPSSFRISLRPGMCQGERAGGPCNFSLLFALLSSLFSLFSNLCHICGSPPAPPDRTRFPGLLRLFASLLPAGTRALPASVSHIHGPGSALSGKRKYKSTKLPNWSPGGFCFAPCLLSLRDLSQHHSPKQTDDDHHPPKPVARPLTNHPLRRRGSTTKEIPTP